MYNPGGPGNFASPFVRICSPGFCKQNSAKRKSTEETIGTEQSDQLHRKAFRRNRDEKPVSVKRSLSLCLDGRSDGSCAFQTAVVRGNLYWPARTAFRYGLEAGVLLRKSGGGIVENSFDLRRRIKGH